MKPQLVEYGKIFKKKTIHITTEIAPKKSKINIEQIENYNFFFNVFAILIVITGTVILYYRNKNKEKNKRMYTQKVVQFYHDINKQI